MRVFLLDSTYAGTGTYILKKRDKVYLFRSLRLSAGDVFTARDNDGSYYEARIVDEDTISLTPVSRPDRSLTDTLSGFRGKIAPVCVYQGLCKGRKIILHQSTLEESRYLSEILKDIEKGTLISLFIGSEGGFSDSECSFAVQNGADAAIMPTNILRAETAGIFALGAIENSLYS